MSRGRPAIPSCRVAVVACVGNPDLRWGNIRFHCAPAGVYYIPVFRGSLFSPETARGKSPGDLRLAPKRQSVLNSRAFFTSALVLVMSGYEGANNACPWGLESSSDGSGDYGGELFFGPFSGKSLAES
eukprot:7154828-Prymnesium_polylepis.1